MRVRWGGVGKVWRGYLIVGVACSHSFNVE
jgi:hypothetical protein